MLQFGQTQRYHTELSLRPQDVAQHSFNVAWLCWLLSERDPSAALIMTALAHDAGERWTGDLPAPAKRAAGLRATFDALEATATAKVGWAPPPLSVIERKILKLADVIDGGFYCLRELMLGNTIVVNPGRGGAAINYLSLLEEQLPGIESPSVRTLAHELYDYLRTQIGLRTPRHHSYGTILGE